MSLRAVVGTVSRIEDERHNEAIILLQSHQVIVPMVKADKIVMGKERHGR
jgi:hypothetical protein